MRKEPSKRIVQTHEASSSSWDETEKLLLINEWVRLHNSIEKQFIGLAQQQPQPEGRLLKGFIEIASVLLKNIGGVGSHFRLAECELSSVGLEDLLLSYRLILTYFAYHFSQIIPNHGARVIRAVNAVIDPCPECAALVEELKTCQDQESQSFSSIRGGRCLWDRVKKLLHVKHPDKDSTARLYFQTAPAQDLIYMVEQATAEGWLKFKS